MQSHSTSTPAKGWARNTSTSTKLLSAFVVLCLCLAFVGGIGIWGMNQINSGTVAVADNNLPKIVALANFRSDFLLLGRNLRQAFIETSPQRVQQQLAQLTPTEQSLQVDLTTYLGFEHSIAENQIIGTMQTDVQKWIDILHQLEPLVATNTVAADAQVVPIMTQTWGPLGTSILGNLSQLVSMN